MADDDNQGWKLPPIQPGKVDLDGIDKLRREFPWTYYKTLGPKHLANRITAACVCQKAVEGSVLTIILEHAPGDVQTCRLGLMYADTAIPSDGGEVVIHAQSGDYSFMAEPDPKDVRRDLVIAEGSHVIELLLANDHIAVSVPLAGRGATRFDFVTERLNWPPRDQDL